MKKDLTNYEELADRAERGDLQRRHTVYQGDGSEINLASMFIPVGHPLTGEAVVARTSTVRSTEPLDVAPITQAKREGMPKSALSKKQ